MHCELLKPKPLELDGEIPMEKIPSKWIQLKELKLAFCKSEADMVHTKVFGEESETSEKQVPKGETADMEVQVGMSVDPDFFH